MIRIRGDFSSSEIELLKTSAQTFRLELPDGLRLIPKLAIDFQTRYETEWL